MIRIEEQTGSGASTTKRAACNPQKFRGILALALFCVSWDIPKAGEADSLQPEAFHKIQISIAPADIKILEKRPRKHVCAVVRFDGNQFESVQLHLKGHGSFQPIDQKPSLTLNFRRAHALDHPSAWPKIHLNNSAEDPSFLHEYIGTGLVRDAGLPSPHVAHALVLLNGRELGLYVLQEGFTKEFLAQAFPGTSGVLYEPDPVSGGMVPRGAGHPTGDAVDRESFTTFAAMEMLIVHRDGYSLAANNFRVYDDCTQHALFFLPTGMDQIFGKKDFPLCAPRGGELARTMFAAPSSAEELRTRMGELLPLLAPRRLDRRIDLALAVLKGNLPSRRFNEIRLAADDLKVRIADRYEFLEKTLTRQAENRWVASAAINSDEER